MGRATAWILGVGLVALVGIVGASLLLPDPDDEAGPAVAVPSVDDIAPMTAPTGGASSPVPADRIRVTASSTFPAIETRTYDASNTIDGDLATAWNSDAPDGTEGRGEILTYRFAEPVAVTAIRFVNGYARGDDVYVANHRIREILVITDATSQPVSLLDTADRQEISFDFGYTSQVVLEVRDIFPGAGFEDPDLRPDLALTEIEFLAMQRTG